MSSVLYRAHSFSCEEFFVIVIPKFLFKIRIQNRLKEMEEYAIIISKSRCKILKELDRKSYAVFIFDSRCFYVLVFKCSGEIVLAKNGRGKRCDEIL